MRQTNKLCGCGLNEVILADGLREVWWLQQEAWRGTNQRRETTDARRRENKVWGESLLLRVHIKSVTKSCVNNCDNRNNNNIVVIAQSDPGHVTRGVLKQFLASSCELNRLNLEMFSRLKSLNATKSSSKLHLFTENLLQRMCFTTSIFYLFLTFIYDVTHLIKSICNMFNINFSHFFSL